jgi:L-asparaginase II
MSSAILARVVRGETVESIHRGHFIVIDGDKNVVASAGDPETVTFYRSACKALQALPFVMSGGADRFGFNDDELALACASHSGEPMHVDVAARMLRKAGFTETDLRCGTHLPFSEKAAEELLRIGEKPSQLHNNCSGKHAAMLAFARHIDSDPSTYDSIDHPIQQEILKTVAMFAEVPVDSIAIGTDGCAVPNFAIPIDAMAHSFANLINPPDSFGSDVHAACKQLVAAMTALPELIGGNDRLDTILMQAAPGRLISKVGADGVWLCAVLPNELYGSGLAIALKIEDGDDKRARPVVAVELLRELGVLSESQLSDISPIPLKNRRGDQVGRVQAILPKRPRRKAS